jgi:hypothetical protein
MDKELEMLKAKIKSLETHTADLIQALDLAIEYLEDRADTTWDVDDDGTPLPNRELNLLSEIQHLINGVI